MTAATIWILFLAAVMADGRILTTSKIYAGEAECRAAGMITTDRLLSSGVPASFTCQNVPLESLTVEEAIAGAHPPRPTKEPEIPSRYRRTGPAH